MLDRQVRDAAARVERVGVDERARRARVEAGAAAAAARLRRRRRRGRRELRRDQQLAEHDVRAEPGRDHHRVLGDEADARALRPLALVHRRRVDARPRRDRRAERSCEPVRKRDQLVAHHHVVVVAAGVACDAAAHERVGGNRRVATVAERDDDERPSIAEQRVQIRARRDMLRRRQVAHVAGATGVEPRHIDVVPPRRLDRHDRDAMEAELARERDDVDAQRAPSRSSSSGVSAKNTSSYATVQSRSRGCGYDSRARRDTSSRPRARRRARRRSSAPAAPCRGRPARRARASAPPCRSSSRAGRGTAAAPLRPACAGGRCRRRCRPGTR